MLTIIFQVMLYVEDTRNTGNCGSEADKTAKIGIYNMIKINAGVTDGGRVIWIILLLLQVLNTQYWDMKWA